ncbi:hypothetical protein VPH35_000707 [Triticum aestivum]
MAAPLHRLPTPPRPQVAPALHYLDPRPHPHPPAAAIHSRRPRPPPRTTPPTTIHSRVHTTSSFFATAPCMPPDSVEPRRLPPPRSTEPSLPRSAASSTRLDPPCS